MSPAFLDKPPPAGSADWMRWFRNPQCTEPFDIEAATTDFR